jgi:hypothetical protein
MLKVGDTVKFGESFTVKIGESFSVKVGGSEVDESFSVKVGESVAGQNEVGENSRESR